MAKDKIKNHPAPVNPDMGITPPVREPITERGNDLLKALYDHGGLYLTVEEGKEAVDAGDATVNKDDTQGNTALVMLTPQGAAKVAPQKPESAPKVTFEIDDYAPPLPNKKRGGKRGSKYPFDALEVGKSFHVPVTKEIPNPVSALASSLTGARRRYEQPVMDGDNPVMETVKIKTYALDSKGKRIKDASGKFVVIGEKTETRPKMVQTRDFYVVAASKDDPKGPGARVVRSR